jgi:hypothetical protein
MGIACVGTPPGAAEPGRLDKGRYSRINVGADPLFVLGDLNGDGVVDRADRELLRQIVESGGNTFPPGAKCPAAGDLFFERKISKADLDELDSWMKYGPVDAPALAYSAALPCSFTTAFIAAQLKSIDGGPVSLQFLDGHLNAANTTVTVIKGAADVRPEPDGTGFVVHPRQQSGSITLSIVLPGSRKYLYTFPISGPAGAR